ncbi:Pentatricopeptide repeat-containing protein [Apostasia shenzhenica]|uniref:Pentatricopeptide repeat-containing protein n=1 Tax=Apostasia shenzhenica TaxID=1088818 RepID=A0A2I0A5N9_9ASPA|nr:Pentatricopeptide repeat-containing protein [Apostasia shenzhenica]
MGAVHSPPPAAVAARRPSTGEGCLLVSSTNRYKNLHINAGIFLSASASFFCSSTPAHSIGPWFSGTVFGFNHRTLDAAWRDFCPPCSHRLFSGLLISPFELHRLQWPWILDLHAMAIQRSMKVWRKHVNSSIDYSVTRNPSFKPTIDLPILEERLQRGCQNPKLFLQIHAQMTVSGFIKDTYAASRLFSFSTNAHFLDLEYSRRLLHQIEYPNGFIWNTMMRAYNQKNSPQWCFPLYKSMLECDIIPDNYTYPIVVQACALQFCVIEGKQIHTHISKVGFDSDVYAVNTLINMYSACGHLEDARFLFDESLVLDSVSWNSILAGYVQFGDVDNAVYIFNNMPEQNNIASNSMIALFGRSNRVEDARKLFDEMLNRDIVTWTAMINCYEQNGMFRDALELFYLIKGYEILIDEVVMVSLLSACASLGATKEGELIHGLSIRIGFETYVNLQNALIHLYSSCGKISAAQLLFDSANYLDQISWNSMISGYIKCGLLEKARNLFDSMPQKDVVSWSTMISGYTKHACFSDALALFSRMQIEGIKPDETTLVSILSACTNLSALEQGKWVHSYLKKHEYTINVFLGTTLIDMYMKCGCTETAIEVFNGMDDKGTSTWNAVILGLAINGFFEEALNKFSDMERHGVVPNEITFVVVLGVCRHGGLVNEGRKHFNAMKQVYNMKPNIKHYGCMVDLLGRAGLLVEAEDLITNMPIVPDVATWGALLGACRKHGNVEMGERVGRKLVEFEPQHDGFHVLLSNIYASKGKWDELMEIRSMMKQRKVVKLPGCSMIEADGVVHEFLSGDNTHPQMSDIERMLEEIARRLKREGYEPNTIDVAFDIEGEEKESSVYKHSEKLAIAFGLISTSQSMPIRIMKNLRICEDCHIAAKIISRAFDREIVIRDKQRFHHFRMGVCSCSDYW